MRLQKQVLNLLIWLWALILQRAMSGQVQTYNPFLFYIFFINFLLLYCISVDEKFQHNLEGHVHQFKFHWGIWRMLTVECSRHKITKFQNFLLEYSCYLIMLIHKDLGGLLALPYQNLIFMISWAVLLILKRSSFLPLYVL